MYRVEFVDHCVLLSRWLAGHPEALLTVLPMGLLLISATRSVRTAREQVRNTRRLLRDLGPSVLPTARLVAMGHRLGIHDRLDVVDNPVPAVFCHRLWKPRVCVTTRLLDLLDDEELGAVLIHERHHIFRHDPARLVAARMILACTGFLPGARAIYHQFYTASELAADAAAAELPGGRLALASAMLKLVRMQRTLLADGAAVSALSTVPSRVEALLSPAPEPTRVPWFSVAETTAALVLVVVLMSAPVVLAARPEVIAMHPCATAVEPPPAPVNGPDAARGGP